MTDDRVGLHELSKDVARKRVNWTGCSSVMVLLGRADVIAKRNFKLDMENFLALAFETFPKMRFRMTGPMVHPGDSQDLIHQMMECVQWLES